MRITCTVEEFGKIVRGCERAECWKCPLESLCKDEAGSVGDCLRGPGIERFVMAADIVAGPEDGCRQPDDLFRPLIRARGDSDG